jgi:hypothetical protein
MPHFACHAHPSHVIWLSQLIKPDPRVLNLFREAGSLQGVGSKASSPPAILALNKVDSVPLERRQSLLPLADSLARLCQFEDIFWISGLRGEYMSTGEEGGGGKED